MIIVSAKAIVFALTLVALSAGTANSRAANPARDDDLVPSQPLPMAPNRAPMRLRVEGTRLLNASGEPVLLRGVNIASLEWTTQGEHMEQAFDQAIHVWKANIIRMPLAQDRWFGKTSGQQDAGAGYRALVDRLAEAAGAAGTYIDLDLHWSDCGGWANEGARLSQHSMPDAHSILFWKDAATRYKNQQNVILGLYNEPHDIKWTIWRDGGTVTEKPSKKAAQQAPVVYQAVGMQTLYDTVRAAGAGNVVTASGNQWGYDLRGVLQGYAIAGTNIIYETHPYPWKKDWDKSFGDVSKQYAVFMGEWGGSSKDLEYARRLMDYAQTHHLNWTAWCFHPSCGPPLLKNWAFEPNDFGRFVKESLAKK